QNPCQALCPPLSGPIDTSCQCRNESISSSTPAPNTSFLPSESAFQVSIGRPFAKWWLTPSGGSRWTSQALHAPLRRYRPRVVDRSVFKAYDVRGLYPSQLDEEGAYAIGRAYVDQFSPQQI